MPLPSACPRLRVCKPRLLCSVARQSVGSTCWLSQDPGLLSVRGSRTWAERSVTPEGRARELKATTGTLRSSTFKKNPILKAYFLKDCNNILGRRSIYATMEAACLGRRGGSEAAHFTCPVPLHRVSGSQLIGSVPGLRGWGELRQGLCTH